MTSRATAVGVLPALSAPAVWSAGCCDAHESARWDEQVDSGATWRPASCTF